MYKMSFFWLMLLLLFFLFFLIYFLIWLAYLFASSPSIVCLHNHYVCGAFDQTRPVVTQTQDKSSHIG